MYVRELSDHVMDMGLTETVTPYQNDTTDIYNSTFLYNASATWAPVEPIARSWAVSSCDLNTINTKSLFYLCMFNVILFILLVLSYIVL